MQIKLAAHYVYVNGVRRGGSQGIKTQTEITLVQYQELVIIMKINSMEGHQCRI